MVSPLASVTVAGEDVQSGAYLLRIEVSRPVAIRFGRFSDGQPLLVPAGIYVYIGSAGGRRGSASLASRLVRHATRCSHAPHAIREPLLRALHRNGLGPPALRPPARKKLYWHVDYLLESAAAEVRHIFVLRTPQRAEPELACRLAHEPGVRVLAKGLGAGDAPGATHLLRVPDSLPWWGEWVSKIGEGKPGGSRQQPDE